MEISKIGSLLAGAVAIVFSSTVLADDPSVATSATSSTATSTTTSTSAPAATPESVPPIATGTIKCSGTNACKSQSACKTATNACKGQNACKGKGISMMNTEKDCTDASGTVVKDTDATTK